MDRWDVGDADVAILSLSPVSGSKSGPSRLSISTSELEVESESEEFDEVVDVEEVLEVLEDVDVDDEESDISPP